MGAFKAVAFDYDGTLFDTRPAIVHSIQRTFENAGRPVPPLEDIVRTIASGAALPDTFLILDRVLRQQPATLQDRIKTYRAIYLAEGMPLLNPFAGVHNVLRQLRDDCIKCIVISNKGIAAIERSLAIADLTSFIDMVLADAPGMPRKPDPRLLTDHVLPKFAGLRNQDILMVGDTEADIHFAKATGMACCWAAYGFGDAERCRALKPEYEIAGIEELPAIIASPA
ncbi:MAG TPA: HAD family hydrolase [Xanthobacteraceae bacterium]|jgi:phosphoglycolate phosphatase|nr:HAD family hydrolase [Xanthobacteraceae bacterium]